MTEMASAPPAMHFGSHFRERIIDLRSRRVGLHVPKRRPAIAAIVFFLRRKDHQLAPGARIRAWPFLSDQRAGKGGLRPPAAQNFETIVS
jgi:hypothetical protein